MGEMEDLRKLLDDKRMEAAEILDINQKFVKTSAEMGTQFAKDARRNFNEFITIAGTRPSIGKSSAGASILEWFERLNYPNLPRSELMLKLVRENFTYTGLQSKMLKEFKSKYFQIQRYSGLLVDEAKRLAYKRRFNSAENMELNEFVAECRKLVNEEGLNVGNKLTVFCLDSLFSLDKDTRNQVNTHFEVIGRGVAIIIEPDPTPAPDRWYLDYFQKTKMKYLDRNRLKVTDLKELRPQIHLYLDMPNFSGVMIYPNLDFLFQTPENPGPIESEYLRLDVAAKLAMKDEQKSTGTKENIKKERFAELGRAFREMKRLGSYNWKEVAGICKVRPDVVTRAVQAAAELEALESSKQAQAVLKA